MNRAELERLHDCFLASVYGQSDEMAERIISMIGTTVDEFALATARGLVIVSGQYPRERRSQLHYLVLLRAETDIYKVITTAHWTQILEPPADDDHG